MYEVLITLNIMFVVIVAAVLRYLSLDSRHIRHMMLTRTNRDVEYILCSAIWYDTGMQEVHQPANIVTGFVIGGMRHHNAIAGLWRAAQLSGRDTKLIDKQKMRQGFLTSRNRFVFREEAYLIAVESRQILPEVDPHPEKPHRLHSEDLY